MYEAEINKARESANQIPRPIRQKFETKSRTITHRSVLRWSEHCTECALPACYQTCGLYEARKDGKCRRFVDGMVRIDGMRGLAPYLLKIRFKRWGKLWAVGTPHLFPCPAAQRQEQVDLLYASLLGALPLPKYYKTKITQGHYNRKKEQARNLAPEGTPPNYFLLECYNPNNFAVDLTISISPWRCLDAIPFQRKVVMAPGFNSHKVPGQDIFAIVPIDKPLNYEIIPNDTVEETSLIFGFMDFVRDTAWQKPSLCKCVVWDLDHTLWDGTLVEDGRVGIKLKTEVLEVIKELDKRGIVHSIASKNDEEHVLQILQDLGIKEYFLFPQISWGPKGAAVKAIAQNLNIGLDTIIFVDDSAFERAQVADFCPEVITLDAQEHSTLLDRSECQGTRSSESSRRRLLYQDQYRRMAAEQSFEGSYVAFLEKSQIGIKIELLSSSNLERAYELAQRTNQMNFSGNRYSKDELAKLLSEKKLDAYTITCEDRYGSYGTIGLCIVDPTVPEMTDLMFSCRVQSKRVEHGVMTWLLGYYLEKRACDFYASIKKTERNAPARKVFDDFGFEVVHEENDVRRLVFRKDQPILDDAIIKVDAL